ncbi:unnamed protein product [Closterium sp. Naga37s-1]|nr:unnamed protein product [Closterium sp. Naga37s-1]
MRRSHLPHLSPACQPPIPRPLLAWLLLVMSLPGACPTPSSPLISPFPCPHFCRFPHLPTMPLPSPQCLSSNPPPSPLSPSSHTTVLGLVCMPLKLLSVHQNSFLPHHCPPAAPRHLIHPIHRPPQPHHSSAAGFLTLPRPLNSFPCPAPLLLSLLPSCPSAAYIQSKRRWWVRAFATPPPLLLGSAAFQASFTSRAGSREKGSAILSGGSAAPAGSAAPGGSAGGSSGRRAEEGEGRGAGPGRCLHPGPRRDIARVSLQSAEDSWCESTGAGLSGVAGDYGGSGAQGETAAA